jgi:lysophospholipase L1-like esterase
MMFSFFRFLCFAAAMGLVIAASAKAVEPEDPSVIMMFGDSITYGTGVLNDMRPGIGGGAHKGPSVLELERLLLESRRNSLVLNWGWGGTPSGGSMHEGSGLNRLASNIDTTMSSHAASQYFILIQYGTNDEGYGISTETTRANNEAMVGLARSKGVTPLLANLTPRSDENVVPRNFAIASVAADQNVPFVDHHSTFTSFSMYFVLEPKFNNPDEMIYLHPNQMGYDKLAANWFQSSLMALIEPSPEPPIVLTPMFMLLLDDD